MSMSDSFHMSVTIARQHRRGAPRLDRTEALRIVAAHAFDDGAADVSVGA
jgi:hypothetical protein